jgi:hypothetical protein
MVSLVKSMLIPFLTIAVCYSRYINKGLHNILSAKQTQYMYNSIEHVRIV